MFPLSTDITKTHVHLVQFFMQKNNQEYKVDK